MRSAITSRRGAVTLAIFAVIALMPVLGPALGQPFYVDVFTRVMIWGIAAVSLNLILGYGGMISFGHAAYLGVAGYTIGIMSDAGIDNGFLQWPLALAVSGLAALIIGAICLRTRGLYFIMITLAFGQMIFFLGVSSDRYGSNDGLPIYARSEFGVGGAELNLGNGTLFYYITFALLLLSIYAVHRIVNSRFGMVIRGSKSNEARMNAIGVSTYRYKLTAFVIAGVMCGLAGVLSANFERFISPDTMDWPRSGEMIFMVVLGGMGSLFGPVLGAAAFLLLSEILSNITEAWNLIFGPFLILVVLFARGGINGLLGSRAGRHD